MSQFGQGAFQTWMRAGYKEVTQILSAFPDSVWPVELPGLPGNLTPQEVGPPEGCVSAGPAAGATGHGTGSLRYGTQQMFQDGEMAWFSQVSERLSRIENKLVQLMGKAVERQWYTV